MPSSKTRELDRGGEPYGHRTERVSLVLCLDHHLPLRGLSTQHPATLLCVLHHGHVPDFHGKPMRTNLTTLCTEFLESEQASGVILILCTLTAIVIANSPLGKGFLDFWHFKVGVEIGSIHLKYSVEHWINDGLMAIFFLLIGLEIERELYVGELSHLKNASLPLFAALGGMAMPALLHFGLNW